MSVYNSIPMCHVNLFSSRLSGARILTHALNIKNGNLNSHVLDVVCLRVVGILHMHYRVDILNLEVATCCVS